MRASDEPPCCEVVTERGANSECTAERHGFSPTMFSGWLQVYEANPDNKGRSFKSNLFFFFEIYTPLCGTTNSLKKFRAGGAKVPKCTRESAPMQGGRLAESRQHNPRKSQCNGGRGVVGRCERNGRLGFFSPPRGRKKPLVHFGRLWFHSAFRNFGFYLD